MSSGPFRLSRVRGVPVTDAQLIEDLRRVAALRGSDTVSQPQYSEHGRFDMRNLSRRLGGWDAALAVAGLKPTSYQGEYPASASSRTFLSCGSTSVVNRGAPNWHSRRRRSHNRHIHEGSILGPERLRRLWSGQMLLRSQAQLPLLWRGKNPALEEILHCGFVLRCWPGTDSRAVVAERVQQRTTVPCSMSIT